MGQRRLAQIRNVARMAKSADARAKRKDAATRAKRNPATRAKPKEARHRAAPLTADEIVRKEDLPATEPMPAEIAEKLARRRIVLSSADEDFDPRGHWKKVDGSKGAWELTSEAPVSHGLFVERAERVETGSLRRGTGEIAPFRPAWQPLIFHPRQAYAEVGQRIMRRKNGAKVQPDTVFNRDDREMFYPTGYPWHCIGRVFVTTSVGPPTTGTGTLVGTRTVLTSEHMIPWGAPGLTVRFVPGYFAGTAANSVQAYGAAAVQSWVTDVWGYVNAKQDGSPGLDVAVLRLAEPLGAWLGTFGATAYDDEWEDETWWTLVGYPGQVGVTITGTFPGVLTSFPNNSLMPTRQFGISVEDDDADGDGLEIEHRADTTPGNSGGPLFGFFADRPYIIGIHSGGDESLDFNIAAGGNAMLNLIRWARATWA